MLEFEKINSILIIGAAGNLAKLLIEKIHNNYPNIKITGVDSRRIPKGIPRENFNYLSMEYTRGNFEKLFRENTFDCVYLLGRFAHVGLSPLKSIANQLGTSISGVKNLLDLCPKFKVKKIIVLSSFHVYGAFADNPIFLNEDTTLKADLTHPEVRDVVEMDKISALWRMAHPEVETTILRPCNLIGPRIQNAITKYLRLKNAPVPIDYNPNLQFIHELDFLDILMKAVTTLPPDIYNVATDEYISLREAKNLVGVPTIPIPIFLLIPTTKFLKKTLWGIPDYLMDYIKFPCIIDNTKLKKALGALDFKHSLRNSLQNLY